jgi:DNA polymerase-4
MRQIAHLDLEAFFINCTLLKLPELKGKPLIIGGSNNRGMVASASPEAKKYGVHKSMPTRTALQRCPDAVILKGDFDLYTKYSDIVNEIITERAPLHERYAIDEFFMDMTGMDRFHGSFSFTKELVDKIKKETGLPMLFGLSVNKTVAKICTAHARPLGSYEVAESSVQNFLDPQSIKRIPAIGPVSYKLLRRIRIKLIKNIRTLPPEAMNELLGKTGLTIWKKANGIDPTPVIPYSSKKSISKEHTFETDTQSTPLLKATLLKLIEELAFKLRKLNQMCACVSIRIRYANHDTESAQKRIPFSSNDELLIQTSYELFERLYKRRMLIRFIAVKFSNLVNGNYQIDLFADDLKKIQLYQAMDKLKNKYNNPALVHRAFSL